MEKRRANEGWGRKDEKEGKEKEEGKKEERRKKKERKEEGKKDSKFYWGEINLTGKNWAVPPMATNLYYALVTPVIWTHL